MARYRKVEVKTWSDGKFRELTPVPPCGQGLWLWLLTGSRTTNIPGIVIGTDHVMAAELNWPVEGFRKAFREVFAKGMAKGDLGAGLIWLPNASRVGDRRNKPESPNVIRSWRDTWDEVPECSLKLEAWQQLKAFAQGFGEGFLKAFLEACRKPLTKASPNQEQEQEQEQDSPPTPQAGGVSGVDPSRPESDPPLSPQDAWRDVTECDPEAYEAWLAYRDEAGDAVPPSVRIVHAKFLGGKGSAEEQRAYVAELIRRQFKRLHDPFHRGEPGRSGTGRSDDPPVLLRDVYGERPRDDG